MKNNTKNQAAKVTIAIDATRAVFPAVKIGDRVYFKPETARAVAKAYANAIDGVYSIDKEKTIRIYGDDMPDTIVAVPDSQSLYYFEEIAFETAKEKALKTVKIYARSVLVKTGYRAPHAYKEEEQISIFYGGKELYSNHYERIDNPRLRIPFSCTLETRSRKALKEYSGKLSQTIADKWLKAKIVELLENN